MLVKANLTPAQACRVEQELVCVDRCPRRKFQHDVDWIFLEHPECTLRIVRAVHEKSNDHRLEPAGYSAGLRFGIDLPQYSKRQNHA
jgi:hypothetical protein